MSLQDGEAGTPGNDTRSRMRALLARIPPHAVVLVLVLVLAFGTRALRCGEGLPYLHEWDEPQTASIALRMLQTGDFNPRYFHYGSVMIYLNLAVDVIHYFHLASKPATDPDSLDDLSGIVTKRDTGYWWTISHPSFIFWNRLLTALMGTATVLFAYILARDLKGPWAGVLAASLLAGSDFHIEHSALVTPNVPMVFFGMAGVLLAVRYLRLGSPATLVGAAVACGLATSTKYNAVLALTAPLLALGVAWWGWLWRERRYGYRGWLWLAVLLAPPLAFLAGTPYAVLDLPRFVQDVGYEIRHYQVQGHAGSTIEPGLTHLMYQSRLVIGNLGILPALFATVGVVGTLISAAGWVTFIFPLISLLYMSGTTISMPRNFLVLYAFASVGFGCGVMIAVGLVRRLRMESRRQLLVRTAIVLVAVLACGAATARSLRSSWNLAGRPETRTLVIDKLNELTTVQTDSPSPVGIAAELRIHPFDLARLKTRYHEAPLFDLFCAEKGGYGLLVTPWELSVDRPEYEDSVTLMNALVKSRMPIVAGIGRDIRSHLDVINIDPRVLILPQRTGSSAAPLCGPRLTLRPIRHGALSPEALLRANLDNVGPVMTDWSMSTRGPHAFIWSARGRSETDYFPQVRARLRFRFGSVEVERGTQDLDVGEFDAPYAMRFEAPEGAEVSLSFEQAQSGELEIGSVRIITIPR